MQKILMITVLYTMLLFPFAVSGFSWDDVQPCQPVFIRLSFVDSDATSKMGITWQTKNECSAELRYGSDFAPDKYVKGATIKGNNDLGYIHQVTLEGLTHSTFYQYQVGGENNWSILYNFTTAPFQGGCDPFAFVVASDSRVDQTAEEGNPVKWRDIFTEALNDGASFLINGGDMVWDGEKTSQWLNYLDTTSDSFAAKPLIIAMGNHDNGPGEGENANFNQLMHYPENPVTETEDSYFFRYGNALFIIISTVTYTDLFEDTAKWMDEVLTNNSDAKWKFVFNHHPFYSSAGLEYLGMRIGHEMNEQGQNPFFIPIFDKHHVDFVISAHSHYYERFAPSYGYIDRTDPDEIEPQIVDSFDKGTVYVVSGGGGAITFQNFLVDMLCTNSIKGSQSCNGKNHYLKFMIDNNRLVMEMWTTMRQFDGFNPNDREMVDVVEIIKADASCETPEETPDEEPADNDTNDEDIEPLNDESQQDEDITESNDEDSVKVDDNTQIDEITEEPDDEDNPSAETPGESGCGCTLIF